MAVELSLSPKLVFAYITWSPKNAVIIKVLLEVGMDCVVSHTVNVVPALLCICGG